TKMQRFATCSLAVEVVLNGLRRPHASVPSKLGFRQRSRRRGDAGNDCSACRASGCARCERQPSRLEMKKLLITGIAVLPAVSAAYAAGDRMALIIIVAAIGFFWWLMVSTHEDAARDCARWGPQDEMCLQHAPWRNVP